MRILLIIALLLITQPVFGGEITVGRFINTTDTVSFQTENDGSVYSSSGDGQWRTQGGCAFETVETAEHSYKIQMDGDGTSDEFYMRRGAIIAIPVGDLENVYTDSQVSETYHTDSWSDTNVVLSSQAVNAADHMVIVGVEFSNESNYALGDCRLISDGNTYQFGSTSYRDSDSNEFWVAFAIHPKTLSSGNSTFEVEGNSSSSSSANEACIRNAYLAVCEIPAAAAPSSAIKTVNGLAKASVKTIDGLAIGSVKSWNGLE